MQSILAVDDSASMRQMVTFTLKSAGYHVVKTPGKKPAVPVLIWC
jgi:CheY-like chemotaxis protein